MQKAISIFLLFFVLSFVSIAQQSAIYTDDLVKYTAALSLYNSQQYLAAQTVFQEIQNETSDTTIKGDCAYYIANAAVRLNQQGADDLMQAFVEEYPTSTKRNSAFLDVADYYFSNGKYSYARKWYDRVDEDELSGAAQEKYNFNNGYAFFKNKRCLLYTSPSPRDLSTSRMPSSA